MTVNDYTLPTEQRKIWFLDCIRGRIGHEFTMEDCASRAMLVWLCDDPSVLQNQREYDAAKLRAHFAVTQFYIDKLVEQLGQDSYRITPAGLKLCKEVMIACGLDGANDNVR